MRIILLVALMLAAALTLQAQQYNFRNWSLEQGLPQSQVNAILQDHQGQLWVATMGGLSRFDGTAFHTYTKRNGMSSNSTSCLLQDSRQRIWIGTQDRGLMYFSGNSFCILDAEAGLPRGGVHAIAEDTAGTIWAATDSGVYSLAGNRFVAHDALPRIRYSALLVAQNSELWAGSASEGLFRVTAQGVVSYSTSNSGLPHNTVNVLKQSPSGTVWIGTVQGAATFRHGTLQRLDLPPGLIYPDVTGFTTDAYGRQWLSLRDRGALLYDGHTFEHLTRSSGLRTDRVNAIATDREGNIWMGTSGHGLVQYRNPWFVHYFDLGPVKEPVVSALAQDASGRIWLGTDDGHAALLEAGNPSWLRPGIWPPGTTLHSMWVRHQDDVWVCTSHGLYHMGPNGASRYGAEQGLPSPEVYQALPGTDGTILLATAAGLAVLSPDSRRVRHAQAPQVTGRVYTLHRDARGRLWLGAEKGVFRYENDRVVSAPGFDQTDFREVITIAEDTLGTLYFGGFNYGILATHDAWAGPKVYNSQNGLPNEGVKCLYVDQSNHLWIGTSSGVLKARLGELHRRGRLSIRSYTNQDGFRGLEVSNGGITQTPDGTVWFATAKGLTRYLPAMDRRNRVYPTPVLTSIMLFLKPTDWAGLGYATDSVNGLPLNLQLPAGQNHITFDFQGISLTAPDRVRYRYRLKGHDDHWSAVTGHSFATYASLDPGDYTFQLLASNSDGFWTPDPLTYSFTIVPPVWRREWFILLLLLIAAAAAISMVRLRERSLVKLNTLLELKVQHRTQLLEEKNREKEILLKEIHHRVKNNLQIIMSMINLQARHVKDPNALEVMRAIKGRVRSMSILHERLYQHADLASINLQDYFEDICRGLYATYGVSREQIPLRLHIPSIMVEADTALSLGLILNELVSNSLKYAFPEKRGELNISLRPYDEHFHTLSVQDDGAGLPPDFEERRKKSFGLQLVASLAKKLRGNVDFKSNNGTNSILYFVLAS